MSTVIRLPAITVDSPSQAPVTVGRLVPNTLLMEGRHLKDVGRLILPDEKVQKNAEHVVQPRCQITLQTIFAD